MPPKKRFLKYKDFLKKYKPVFQKHKVFSLNYGFFAVMGGIATSDVAKLKDTDSRLFILTPDAILQFAHRGVFFDLSSGMISDKSKVNLVGKGLVCVQVIWFFIQCVARRAAQYPLVLLEVHTMVHVICALLMYGLWWKVSLEIPRKSIHRLIVLLKKPQDISEPAIQDTSDHLDLLAMLIVMSGSHQYGFCEGHDIIYYGKEILQRSPPLSSSNERQVASHGSNNPMYEVKVVSTSPLSQAIKSFDRTKGQVVALLPGQALDCGIGPFPSLNEKVTYLSAKDVLRWRNFSEWLDCYNRQNPTKSTLLSHFENQNQEYSLERCKAIDLLYTLRSEHAPATGEFKNTLRAHVPNLPGEGGISIGQFSEDAVIDFVLDNILFPILLVALSLVYGGIHLTAWNFHFASKTEHLLWKIACIDIMGTIPIGLLSSFLWLIWSPDHRTYFRRICFHLMETCSRIIFTALAIFYTLSRVYIVVESFISLRHVPIGAFAAIPWVQDIPHV